MMNERRIRRLSYLGLVVLLPVALWTDAREDVVDSWHRHAFKPIDVAPESAAQFTGLQWRLLSMEQKNNVTPDRSEITVRIQVEPVTKDAVKPLGRCAPYLEDASGQRWSPLPSNYRQISCSGLAFRDDAIGGGNAVITERFVVPRARAKELTLAIVIPDARPQYLRFQRAPE
jgi:hypothetical protein